MGHDPDPKDYDTKADYMAAVRDRLDYGFCNPMKAKFAHEDEQDASERWDEYHR
jgi:hypothetical protein